MAPGEALAEHPALEVRAQLLLDVPGQPALVVLAGVREKRLEVPADQAVQDRLGRALRSVAGGEDGHGDGHGGAHAIREGGKTPLVRIRLSVPVPRTVPWS